MKDTINQFMWGHQQHFRVSIESFAKHAFDEFGAWLDPRAYLVGFNESGSSPFAVCVEPETGPFSPEHFSKVSQFGEERYLAHDFHDLFMTDKQSNDRFHRELLDRCRADALAEVFSESKSESNRTYFAGHSAVVEGFRVYPVLSILNDKWMSLPRLCKVHMITYRHEAEASLQDALVREILRGATGEMNKKEPPGFVFNLGSHSVQETIRHSATVFLDGVITANANDFGSGFFDAMNSVASQPYEGRTGVGTILIAKENESHLVVEIRLSAPIAVQSTRAFRKALEMTGHDLHLLCDGRLIFGLGRVGQNYDPASENVFAVRVVGRGSWEFEHAQRGIFRVDNGTPRFPQERLPREKFINTVQRIFPDSSDAEALWELSDAAAKQEHGTMLVVHIDAEGEATRLAPQALSTVVTSLTKATLTSLTSIDGAILVDPKAQCHAVGVILDGVAITGTGDPSRGARFNSAIRYLHANEGKCLIIIVSEDGMIDLLPDLHRQISRKKVEDVVALLESKSVGDVDFEDFNRQDRLVDSLKFYLSTEQCVRVNKAREKTEDYRELSTASSIRVSFLKVRPDPLLTESYFLPEDEPSGG